GRGKNVRIVLLSALAEAKIGLYQAMRAAGIRKADRARRLGWQRSQVDRLLDLRHASRLDQIETALGALRKRLARISKTLPECVPYASPANPPHTIGAECYTR